METTELQQRLFNHLKDRLPPHISVVTELEDLLGLSADSVYRRIRGEKPISFHELKAICQHFHLSIDELLQLENESVVFQAPGVSGKASSFLEYLKEMVGQFRYFNSFRDKRMFYLCKDIPFWYFFLYPEMAAFKSFFWTKTIHNDPELTNKKFSLSENSFEDCYALGQQVLTGYNDMESVELWNLESINSTINQVAYYREAGVFATRKDEEAIINSFHLMIDHLERQAAEGCKFLPGATSVSYKKPIKFYINELILGNNTILLELDSQRLSLITYSVLSYLITSDSRFAEKAFGGFNSLLSRSTLITHTGEKDRNRFFNNLRQKVDALR